VAKQLIELEQLDLNVAAFHPSADNSFRGPCPSCGGHRRLVVYINGPWPAYYLRCDLCYWGGWAFDIKPELKTAEITANPPQMQVKSADPVFRQQVLSTLPDLVKGFEANLTNNHRLWWTAAGIDEIHQNLWHVGHVSNRGVKDEDGRLHMVSAFTIPKYEYPSHLINIDFRLINPPEGIGRYRPMAGLAPALWYNKPDNEIGTEVVWIFEGSKKAMVMSAFLGDEYPVLGVPSNRSWCGVADMVKNVSRVYVCLDPDSWIPARKLCRSIGPNARQISLPDKADDAVLAGMTREQFDAIVSMAR
jgi:hypothetical protein